MKKENKVNNKLLSNAGFSLMEVLLAVVLLALVAFPIFRIFMVSMKTNNRSREIMKANDLAQEMAEYFESTCYDSMPAPDNVVGLKETLTKTGSALRIPGINYTASDYDNFQTYFYDSITSEAGFLAQSRSTNVPMSNNVCMHSSWGDADGEHLCVNFYNLRLAGERESFDGIVYFRPTKQSDSDKYFVYDVEINIYTNGSKVTGVNNNTTTKIERFGEHDLVTTINCTVINKY